MSVGTGAVCRWTDAGFLEPVETGASPRCDRLTQPPQLSQGGEKIFSRSDPGSQLQHRAGNNAHTIQGHRERLIQLYNEIMY